MCFEPPLSTEKFLKLRLAWAPNHTSPTGKQVSRCFFNKYLKSLATLHLLNNYLNAPIFQNKTQKL